MICDQLLIQTILLTIGVCNLPFLAILLSAQAAHERRERARILNRSLQQPGLPVATEEDRRLLFQEVGHDLWTYKTFQWNIVYYAILLFGAVIGLLFLIESPVWVRIPLYAICVGVLDFALYQLIGLQHEIVQARIRIAKYNDRLFRIGLYWKTETEYRQVIEEYRQFWRAARYLAAFLVSISISFLVASLMLALLRWK